MTRTFKTVVSLVLLVALAIVMLALFAQSAKGQVSIIQAPLGGYGGITTCDQKNNIIVVVNQSTTSADYPEVLAHEMIHVEEMQKFEGGCLSFLARYRADLTFRFQVEARAYCSNYNLLVAQGMPKENIKNLAVYMQKTYAKENSLEEVLAALPCNDGFKLAPTDGTTASPH